MYLTGAVPHSLCCLKIIKIFTSGLHIYSDLTLITINQINRSRPKEAYEYFWQCVLHVSNVYAL